MDANTHAETCGTSSPGSSTCSEQHQKNRLLKRLADLGYAVELAPLPQLLKRVISPHTFRNTTAMHLLQSGVDITVIALWLGHESPATTHIYVEADLAMKERALSKLRPPKIKSVRYRPTNCSSFCRTFDNYVQIRRQAIMFCVNQSEACT